MARSNLFRAGISGCAFVARFFFVVVNRNLFQVVSFEDLAAIQTPHIIDPVPPHYEFRALVFTARHSKQIIPIVMMAVSLSSPSCARLSLS